jgi:hypothetical protein
MEDFDQGIENQTRNTAVNPRVFGAPPSGFGA